MLETHTNQIPMDIHLNDNDISQMPEQLRTNFLNWLPQHLSSQQSQFKREPITPMTHEGLMTQQLTFDFPPVSQVLGEKGDNAHVKLSQLFDAGITKRGMPVRVKLKQEIAKESNRNYINSLEISPQGTIIFDGQEFDKPSPLAKKVNGSEINGWVYIEVKKNDEWICLDELRKIWRKTNGKSLIIPN